MKEDLVTQIMANMNDLGQMLYLLLSMHFQILWENLI